MKGNAYSRMIQIMQRQGEKKKHQPMAAGVVVSVNPLCVKYNNVEVTNGVRCRLPQMPEMVRAEIEKEYGISSELKSFLITLYDTFNLKAGDSVIVQKTGSSLYILGKM